MTKPAKIALSILTFSMFGFVCVGLYPGTGMWKHVFFVLEHAFEGAIVGCICDFLAVQQVYVKAEANYERLTAGVSKTVVREMLQIDELMRSSQNIDEWLQSPENLKFLQDKLQEAIPEDEELKKLVEEVWSTRIHEPLCLWLIHADPQKLLHNTDESEHQGILDMLEVRTSLALCMTRVAHDEELAERSVQNLQNVANNITLVDLGLPSQKEEIDVLARTIWGRWKDMSGAGSIQNFLADKVIRVLVPAIAQRIDTLTIKDILGPTLSKENLQFALERGAERIATPTEEEIPDQLMEAVLDYFDAYLEAWNRLEDVQKHKAIEEFVQRMKPKVIQLLFDVLVDLRDEFLKLQSLKEQVWIEELVSYLTNSLQERSENFGDTAEDMVTERLQQLGAPTFRTMLQKRTQEPLDWIKVNGAIWGFILGACAGGISLLLHHLQSF
jgi:hypothetical protein